MRRVLQSVHYFHDLGMIGYPANVICHPNQRLREIPPSGIEISNIQIAPPLFSSPLYRREPMRMELNSYGLFTGKIIAQISPLF
jgi:hypothetical protein